MPSENDALADLIRISRQLPYTLTVEKVDGNKIYTHNTWGNSVIYVKKNDTFEIFKQE